MKRILTALLAGLVSFSVMAKPVKNFEQAADKVIQSVKKNQLSSLPIECLSFVESDETDVYFYIDVREKHNEQCGGDPQVSPLLFTYSVNKAKGFLHTNAIWREDYGIDNYNLYPIDPISPVIIYNEDNTERKLKYFIRMTEIEIK